MKGWSGRTRAAWIDIDLDSIVHNAEQMRALARRDTGRDILAMPVIKGNAYGHGLYRVARALGENGFTWLGVANLMESLIAREGAPDAKVLILGYTPQDLMPQVVVNEIRQTVYSYEMAEQLSREAQRQGRQAHVHIKIDTGMHRLGFDLSDASSVLVAAITKLPGIDAEGIFSHFAVANEEDRSYEEFQYQNFMRFLEKLEARGVTFPVRHISSAGTVFSSPQYHLDLVRYGSTNWATYSNNAYTKKVVAERLDLRDSFALRAEVAAIKELEPGMGVGYDLTWKAQRPSRIAVLPLGYADISLRDLRNKGYALIHGRKVPLVGSICMDQMEIDITDIKDVKIGDVVTIIGRDGDEEIRLQDVADILGVDGYQIVISAQPRLPIRYWEHGELVETVDVNLTLLEHYRNRSGK